MGVEDHDDCFLPCIVDYDVAWAWLEVLQVEIIIVTITITGLAVVPVLPPMVGKNVGGRDGRAEFERYVILFGVRVGIDLHKILCRLLRPRVGGSWKLYLATLDGGSERDARYRFL